MGIKKEKVTATRMPMSAPFKLVEENDETEYCVRCGTATRYKKTDNVTFRSGYIEGAGQLCFKCSHQRKLHRQGSYDL
jgi:hypothetical protein